MTHDVPKRGQINCDLFQTYLALTLTFPLMNCEAAIPYTANVMLQTDKERRRLNNNHTPKTFVLSSTFKRQTYQKSTGVPNHVRGQTTAARMTSHMQKDSFTSNQSSIRCSMFCDAKSKNTVDPPNRVKLMENETRYL